MRHDDRGGAVGDSRGEDFAGVDEAGGERTDGDEVFVDETVGAI